MTGHASGGGTGPFLALLLALGYEYLALRTPAWSAWRATAFLSGCLALVVGLALPVHDFTGHMWQHLLIAMVAPLGLVLGAPVTLLLRTLPVPAARRLSHLTRTPPVRLITHPVTALLLVIGGLPLLTRPDVMAHPLVTLHFVLAGCLFTWVIAGPDPAPHRPSVPVRLVVLGVAIAAHAGFSQYLYATAPGADQQAGATVMYYGGDLVELLLAFAVVQSRTTRKVSRSGSDASGIVMPAARPLRR